jgi:hypothetical protein
VYLRETIAAGPDAKRKAEKALTRLQNQVDERRTPRTSVTLDQLLDRYLEVAPGTRRDYASKASKHIRPILGSTPIARKDCRESSVQRPRRVLRLGPAIGRRGPRVDAAPGLGQQPDLPALRHRSRRIRQPSQCLSAHVESPEALTAIIVAGFAEGIRSDQGVAAQVSAVATEDVVDVPNDRSGPRHELEWARPLRGPLGRPRRRSSTRSLRPRHSVLTSGSAADSELRGTANERMSHRGSALRADGQPPHDDILDQFAQNGESPDSTGGAYVPPAVLPVAWSSSRESKSRG